MRISYETNRAAAIYLPAAYEKLLPPIKQSIHQDKKINIQEITIAPRKRKVK
jgi:hypothetical protein